MTDALRLCLGTLTVLRVAPPKVVDRKVAGRAMVLAPLVGLLLGVVVVALLWALGGGSLLLFPSDGRFTFASDADSSLPRFSLLPPLLAAAVVVAALALLTRGLHLDGLADTADGLGSGRDPERALDVMRKGDVGPFGLVTLLLVLLLQVAALERLVQSRTGLGGLLAALVLSRAVLPVLCSRGIHPARANGLGAMVAGSVGRWALVAAGLVAFLAFVIVTVLTVLTSPSVFGGITGRDPLGSRHSLVHVIAFLVVPTVVTVAFARRCVRRFGGITGDVLGACVEVAFTAALVVAVL
ncbi:MAG: adenosylcobinamide-GDP ribazoletransferase [Nocardioidaceae bacterium]